jgi:hypothetical protein
MRQKIKLTVLVVSLALISLLNGCKDQGKAEFIKRPESSGVEPRVTLKLKLRPGQYNMSIIEDVTQNIQIQGKTHVEEHTRTSWFELYASEPKSSDLTTCKVSTKRIKGKGNQFGSFDTDDPRSLRNKAAQFMAWQLNYDFFLNFSPDGEFVSASGLDEMWDSLAKKEPSAASFVNQMKEVIGNEFAAEFLYGSAYMSLPDNPVGVGAIWHKKVPKTISMMGNATYDSENELIKLESTPDGQIAHIKHTGRITNNGKGNSQIGSVSMVIKEVDMKIEGLIQMNIDKGLLVMEIMKNDGYMSMTAKNAGGKNMPAKANFKTKTRRAFSPTN